jgi:hypothetical protein
MFGMDAFMMLVVEAISDAMWYVEVELAIIIALLGIVVFKMGPRLK